MDIPGPKAQNENTAMTGILYHIAVQRKSLILGCCISLRPSKLVKFYYLTKLPVQESAKVILNGNKLQSAFLLSRTGSQVLKK